ncbi:GNAT family N-acetyltransferase [Segnochrobactraceae bacterium EtOH-i3]
MTSLQSVPAPFIRDSRPEDLPAIAAIYGHWVRTALASFEYVPPDVAEMATRRAAVLAAGYPYLVAEDGCGRVIGYAYASAYRTRPAYRFAVENSVYVDAATTGGGIGRALMAALIERTTAAGFRLMVAVIGDTANHASIGLHRAMGFRSAGVLPSIGWKHGRWVDSVLMTRPLGDADTSVPGED